VGFQSRSPSGPPWVGHVDSQFKSYEELFAAAEAVESLLSQPGWAHVMRLLDAEAEAVSATADGRLLESRAEYAYAHGRMGGLRAVKLAAQAILDRSALRLEQQQAKHEPARPSLRQGANRL
jgi:hypothetical protein